MATDKTIWALARECGTDFSKLLLSKLEIADESDIQYAIEDSCGKFNVWASNIGALHPSRSKMSLDFRLRDAPLMRSGVISGLERLKRSEKRILGICSGELPNRKLEGSLQLEPDTRVEIHESPTSELQELLLNLSSSLNHLFGLSVLIRRMRPKGRIPDPENYPKDPRDIVTVIDKFPKLKQCTWLAIRLGNATGRRRHFFMYRQQHRERLGSNKRGIRRSLDGGDGEHEADTATTIATTFEENLDHEHNPATSPVLDRRSIFTAATSLVSDYDENQEMGRRIPDIPDMVLDGVQLSYGAPVECPYCRTIQTFMNRYDWKRHVFSDLQPYVCTFQNCTAGLFSTRNEWLKHELDNHRRQWQCVRCAESDLVCSNERDMLTHLKQRHEGTITDDQAPIILKACERAVTTFDSSACPLCTEWDPPARGENNAKEFFRHLAKHQQQISLEALPLFLEGLEIRDDEESESDTHSEAESEGQQSEEQPDEEDEQEVEEDQEMPTSERLFRISLEDLYARDSFALPLLVHQCTKAIELYGLHQQSIYSRPGSRADIRTLRRKFDLDPKGNSPDLDLADSKNFFHNIHNVTGLLKEFLMELPDPLMTAEHRDAFIEAVKLQEVMPRRDGIHALINSLPDPNYATLRCMILHLYRVTENADKNEMNAHNLALVLGPTLMGVGDFRDTKYQIQVLEVILQHTFEIFDEDDD